MKLQFFFLLSKMFFFVRASCICQMPSKKNLFSNKTCPIFQITTCIHNLFSSGSDRWADLYGECQIQCKVENVQTLNCKLEFIKASGYWSAGKRHEVIGTINGQKGKKYILYKH